MAGIYVVSEVFGLRCNLHDSAYTFGGSLIDIWDIFFSFLNSFIPYSNYKWQAVMVYIEPDAVANFSRGL